MPNKYIIELEREQILLIATMTYTVLRLRPKYELGEKLINDLIAQTDLVSRDPKQHDVGISEKPGPAPYSQIGMLDLGVYIPEHFYGS